MWWLLHKNTLFLLNLPFSENTKKSISSHYSQYTFCIVALREKHKTSSDNEIRSSFSSSLGRELNLVWIIMTLLIMVLTPMALATLIHICKVFSCKHQSINSDHLYQRGRQRHHQCPPMYWQQLTCVNADNIVLPLISKID